MLHGYLEFTKHYGFLISAGIIVFCLVFKFAIAKAMDIKQARLDKKIKVKNSTF